MFHETSQFTKLTSRNCDPTKKLNLLYTYFIFTATFATFTGCKITTIAEFVSLLNYTNKMDFFF